MRGQADVAAGARSFRHFFAPKPPPAPSLGSPRRFFSEPAKRECVIPMLLTRLPPRFFVQRAHASFYPSRRARRSARAHRTPETAIMARQKMHRNCCLPGRREFWPAGDDRRLQVELTAVVQTIRRWRSGL